MPALELDDGTVLVQTTSILEYLGSTYNLKGSSPLATYKGHNVAEYWIGDVFNKSVVPGVFAQGEKKEELMAAAKAAVLAYLQKLEQVLPADTKFLTGDSVSVYDFVVAGFFTNFGLDPKNANYALWQEVFATAGPRVQKYVTDFREEMKDYLAARDPEITM